eukprot:436627-Rhodomonas_salina.2
MMIMDVLLLMLLLRLTLPLTLRLTLPLTLRLLLLLARCEHQKTADGDDDADDDDAVRVVGESVRSERTPTKINNGDEIACAAGDRRRSAQGHRRLAEICSGDCRRSAEICRDWRRLAEIGGD